MRQFSLYAAWGPLSRPLGGSVCPGAARGPRARPDPAERAPRRSAVRPRKLRLDKRRQPEPPRNRRPGGAPALRGRASDPAAPLWALPVQNVSRGVQAQEPVVHRGCHRFSDLGRHHFFLLLLGRRGLRLGRRRLRLTGLAALRSLPDPLSSRHLAGSRSGVGGAGPALTAPPSRPRPLAFFPTGALLPVPWLSYHRDAGQRVPGWRPSPG